MIHFRVIFLQHTQELRPNNAWFVVQSVFLILILKCYCCSYTIRVRFQHIHVAYNIPEFK